MYVQKYSKLRYYLLHTYVTSSILVLHQNFEILVQQLQYISCMPKTQIKHKLAKLTNRKEWQVLVQPYWKLDN